MKKKANQKSSRWLKSAKLSESETAALDAGLAEYFKNPNGGSSWEEVKKRIMSRLQSKGPN
ncbi:MAG TPA: hypothetical protein VHM90_03775 [Phycisphaerae bacterium]|jgi:hypothetical protein|nr:hypothetical protein [Phycisphaerae bacterium]